ncbi:MAG: response regulator [Dermatophilaceae bacterium]
MSQPTGKPAPPSGLRVFVVDDERALAGLVGTCLTREGFEVAWPTTGSRPSSGHGRWIPT